MLRIWLISNIGFFQGSKNYADIWKFIANLSPNHFFIYKYQFFRLGGNVIQQIKKVSPYITRLSEKLDLKKKGFEDSLVKNDHLMHSYISMQKWLTEFVQFFAITTRKLNLRFRNWSFVHCAWLCKIGKLRYTVIFLNLNLNLYFYFFQSPIWKISGCVT